MAKPKQTCGLPQPDDRQATLTALRHEKMARSAPAHGAK
jgi:hypothetical protein